MDTNEVLKKVNEEHFKDWPKAQKFCLDCDLVEKMYCKKCFNKLMKALDKFLE